MSHGNRHQSVASGSTTGAHEYSTFSTSTIRLPRLDDYKNKVCKYCCFLCRLSSSLILHPVGPFRCSFDMVVMLLLIYTSIEIPYIMSFGESANSKYIGLFVDCFLFIDIILNFQTAYFDKYDRLRLVTNKKRICKNYLRTWFIIDAVTCIPFELIPNEQNYHYIKALRVFRFFRIIKILRFLKLLRTFDAMVKQFVIREVLVFMRLFKIICQMLLFAHFAACLWWFVGSQTSPSWVDEKGLRGNDVDNFSKYSYSFYWAVVTLFTTGYGDVVATNITEQWICSVCILIGTCFFAYFIGTLTVLITEGDKIKSYQSDKLEEAQSFCEKKKLPKELSRAILTHIRYHCTYNYVFDENELLSILPSYLQHDIHAHVAKQFLLQLEIFQNEYICLPEFIIGLIALKTKSISCNQWFKLYDCGDIAKEFYIQRTGTSTLYKKDQVVDHLSRGSVCGEYSAVLFKKRQLKVECSTWSEFYSISVDDIAQILALYYPKSAHSKWHKIKKYLRSAYRKNVKHSVEINNYIINENIPQGLKTAVPLQTAQPYEESVHLFNKRTNFIAVRRVTTPMPPESDEEDADVEDDIISVSRPEHSLSFPRNKYLYHSYADNDKTPKLPKRKLSTKLIKYHLRSNSAVRDSVIVAHAAKHNRKSHVYHYNASKSEPELKFVSDIDIKSAEMTTLHLKSNEAFPMEQCSSSIDSECSFSSSSTQSSCDGNDNLYTKTGSKRHTKFKKTTKKKRKVGIGPGSFRKVAGAVNRNERMYEQKHSKGKVNEEEWSIDESVLLDALQSKNNNEREKKCTPQKVDANIEHKVDDAKYVSGNKSTNGGAIRLFMPTIQSEQELYTNVEVEHEATIMEENESEAGFNVFGDDETEAISQKMNTK